MVKFATILAALPLAAAYPWAMEASKQMEKRQRTGPDGVPIRDPAFLSRRPNTGSTGLPLAFNAQEQLVNVRPGSANEWRAPRAGDLRGQCPGLNAAANHGFLPRTGIPTVANTVTGLRAAYNMNEDLSLFLGVVSVALAGDIITQTWSIGGSYNAGLGSILSRPRGILGTHNKYEGDASIVRGDAYLNNGNVGVFQMRSWEYLYSLGANGYDLDTIAAQAEFTSSYSLHRNPYYFSGPFSGLVAPAAHHFVINFMSNHSQTDQDGFLTRDVLKSFFSVTGEPGSFVHTPGHERIPENWYKRPAINRYNIPAVLLDDFVTNQMYPGVVRFGGNTGTTNSFTGVNLGDLTGGVFNSATLFEGNNAACFLLQASQAGIPDQLGGLLGNVGQVLNWVSSQLAPLSQSLSCPQLANFNNELFNPFPGA